VLDVGCGPGRLVHALLARGRAALGIDLSPSAVAEAKARGALVLRRDVFAPLPGEGRWASVLLIDGNIGIGGNPERLLRRVRDLLAPGGTLVVEVEPPDHPTEVLQVRVQSPDRTGPWFPWARVSAASIGALASDGDLTATRVQRRGGRWFAWLTRS
jgi:SAM-dependent methyltransferase